MQSLTDRDVGAAKWHTSNQLILCQCESSLSHGRGPREQALNRCPKPLFFFPIALVLVYILFFFFHCLCIWSHLGAPLPLSLTHTHTHTPTHTLTLSRSLLLFSYKRNSVSLWHLSRMKCVQRENVPLNLSPFNALYEKVLNWVKLTGWVFFFFFCTKKRGVIFLYCKFSSVFWDAFIWLKLLMNFLQVQCHWINIQWLSLLKVCQLLRGCF